MEYQIPEPIPEIYINKENSSLKERLFSSKIFWQLSTQEDNTKNFEPTETPSKNIENNELKSYLTIGGGTFIRGAWQPIYLFLVVMHGEYVLKNWKELIYPQHIQRKQSRKIIGNSIMTLLE